MQQTYFAVHGSGASGSMVTVDGLVTNGIMGDGAVMAYHNEAMIQEAVYQTAGGTAETIVAGINMNLVPKDGGNRFAGALKYGKSPASWQGNNLTDRLKALGLSATDKISNFYEFNVEEGGPIVKDTLWFFGAFRNAHYDKPIANTFNVPAGSNIPAAVKACLAAPGSCDQGVSDEKMSNPVARFTWQMSATGSAKWTSTVSSKLLLEAGFSFNRERYDNVYQDGLNQTWGTAAWYAGARKSDNSTGLLWNASSAQLGNYPDKYNIMAAVSYVTGSHNV